MPARPRVMVLANYLRPDHIAALAPYRRMNLAASSWNTALFAELCNLDVELHIVQFYPVRQGRVFRESNVTFHYLPRLPKIDGFTSTVKRRRVLQLGRRLMPDLIHGIGSEHGHLWAAVQRDWPSVVTIHGYLAVIQRLPGHRSLLKRMFLEREERKALFAADAVIATNDYMKARLVADGCDREKVATIPNALNPIYATGCGGEVRDIDILMVGTLHPLKRQDVALEIIANIARAHSIRPRVVVVGGATVDSTAYFDRLQAIKRDARLDNVSFAGVVDAGRLKTYYCRSRLLLHLSAFETDSMVLSEARACGAVPIVNPVASMAQRVRDGFDGYHLRYEDRVAAARRLIQILEHPNDWARMAQNGRAEIRSRDPAAVARMTLGLYRSVIERTAANQTLRAEGDARRP